MQEKILELVGKRVDHYFTGNDNWYQGTDLFFQKFLEEVQEAREEDKMKNSVYLEDELGDVLWTFMCTVEILRREGKIEGLDAVMERCYKKFLERAGENGDNTNGWSEVKAKQKKALLEEHERKYGKK